MRILMISAEAPPLHRAGALVDVLDALPHELRERGHEVSVVLPFYREIRENSLTEANDTGVTVDIRVGEKNYVAEYFEDRTSSGVQLFFVRCDEFFDRPEIYGEHGVSYEDNATRFIFFNKAAIELARRLTPAPQILHVHDWAAALIPVYIQAHNLPFATVLTIHRLAEQGSFWGLDFALTNLPQRFFSLRGVEFFGRLNFLKGGIVFADRITTVSEHHKHEILQPDGGYELDVVLRENAHKVSGILHGAVGILTPLFDRLLTDDVRLIILGEGDPAFETALAIASRRYPTRFAYRRHFDERLAHLIEAGSDITLIPSRFEPSGLIAMYSLRYGALPVAYASGGIQEIVQDYDPTLEPSDSGYGFLCYDYSAEAFWDSVKRARALFRDRTVWTGLIRRAMAREFSWSAAAQRYEELYRGLVGDTELAA